MSLLSGRRDMCALLAGRRVAAASSSSRATSSEPSKAGEDVQQKGEVDERDELGYPVQPPREAVLPVRSHAPRWRDLFPLSLPIGLSADGGAVAVTAIGMLDPRLHVMVGISNAELAGIPR